MTDLERVRQDGLALKDTTNQTPEICLAAVKQNGLALGYISKDMQTEEICLAAVEQNGWALQFVKDQTPEICLAAIEQVSDLLIYHYEDEECHGYDECVLEYVENQTPEVCLAAVSRDWEALRYVDPDFETVDLIKAAITNCPQEDRDCVANLVNDDNALQDALAQLEQEEAEHDDQEEDVTI